MSYWIHPAAERELTEAAIYYKTHASFGIASAFLDEFERVAALLDWNQQLGMGVSDGLRIYPFRRFPYSIVYREADFGPRIYAVSHQRQNPGYWQSLL